MKTAFSGALIMNNQAHTVARPSTVYLLNPGLCHDVLTYPETGPCIPFLFVGS